MKTAAINVGLALLAAILFMGAGALTRAIDEALRLDDKIDIHRQYAETECRPPDPRTEYRVSVEWCATRGECYRSCSIEPRDREEGPAKTMKRLLDRTKT